MKYLIRCLAESSSRSSSREKDARYRFVQGGGARPAFVQGGGARPAFVQGGGARPEAKEASDDDEAEEEKEQMPEREEGEHDGLAAVSTSP
jgi:hypothetical protein